MQLLENKHLKRVRACFAAPLCLEVQVFSVLGCFTGVRTLNAALTDEELAARIATLETQVRCFCS